RGTSRLQFMQQNERLSAVMSALTTEQLVLQTASSSTISEAGARSSLYVFSLSSALVAMGFAAQSPGAFKPFAAGVLPAVFVLGLFTTVRLVDTVLENMQYLSRIAAIRGYYRTLTPESGQYFAPENGRWPEATWVPALQLGQTAALFGTTASMIAFINCFVAGAGITLVADELLRGRHRGLAVGAGMAFFFLLLVLSVLYQRWRFSLLGRANEIHAAGIPSSARTRSSGRSA
ncbi:MAG: hypothetical protein ABI895_40065, partial [Deltaproteobacteria bacterium]